MVQNMCVWYGLLLESETWNVLAFSYFPSISLVICSAISTYYQCAQCVSFARYTYCQNMYIRTVRTYRHYRVFSVPINNTAFIATNSLLCRSKLCLEDFQTFLKSEQKVSFCIYWCCYSSLVQTLLASPQLLLQNRFYSQLFYSLGTLCWRHWEGQAAYDVIHR